MIEVKNRSEESWGPLAKCDDQMFNAIINTRDESTKEHIKVYLKRQKKMKTYRVTFCKKWNSDQFELQAEDEYELSSVARKYFKENYDKIGFKETPRSTNAGGYVGYDTIRYVKVR